MIVLRLADILEERGLSRRMLAQQAGVNVNTICKWAHGDIVMIDLWTLTKVCAALQVMPGQILRWEPDDSLNQRLSYT